MTAHHSLDQIVRGLDGVTGLYRVTEDGRVYSIAHNWRGYGERELAQHPNAGGYPSVRLSIGGKVRHIPVHRLVAFFHLPPRPSKDHEIRHLDGNKQNRNASNLAWGTRSENALDRALHGTERAKQNAAKSIHKRSGERNVSSKFTDEQAESIRARYQGGEKVHQIAADFPDVTYGAVWNIAAGRSYRPTLSNPECRP